MSTVSGGWSGPKIVKYGLVQYVDPGSLNSYARTGLNLKDISGIGNADSTLENGAEYNTDGGGTIYMAGDNDYIDCGSAQNMNGATQFTVETWVKKSAANKQAVVGAWTPSSGWFFQWFTDGNIYFGVQTTSARHNVAGISWSDNYFHLCGVYDGSQSVDADKGLIYSNGVDLGAGVNLPIDTFVTTASNIRVGSLVGYGTYDTAYHGETRVYNRALTPAEILQNYNATKSRYGL